MESALFIVVAFYLLLGADVTAQDETPVFQVRLANGQAMERQQLHAWHDANATPRVGAAPLFDPVNPVRWMLRDRRGPRPQPKAYVEFVGGDRFPGEVTGSGKSASDGTDGERSWILVEPLPVFRRPNSDVTIPLQVDLRHVRAIVWDAEATETSFRAMTAIRKDGARLTFRAVRWMDDAVALLTESQIVTIRFDELAAIYFDAGDAWETYLDHAATLIPSGRGRLIQLETDSGMIALTSTERLRPETYGDNRIAEHWYQIIQPAWCDEPLWVRFSDIRSWRFFNPESVPLTLLAPRVERSEPIFSQSLVPVTNANREGEPLRDTQQEFGWGYTTSAPCELIVSVPEMAIACRGEFGLDPVVGSGGSVRARIELHRGDDVATLFESELLVGAGTAGDTGRLDFSKRAASTEETLHWIADPMWEGAPPGSDPWDIRDMLNWYAPTLELDSERLVQELQRRALREIPAFRGWDLVTTPSEPASVQTEWNTRDWDNPRFREAVFVRKAFVGLRRRLEISPDAQYVAVFAYSPEAKTVAENRLQLRVDGNVVGELPIPIITGRRQPEPVLFPVQEYAGREVAVEIFQLPDANPNRTQVPVEWIDIQVVNHRPGLINLLERIPQSAPFDLGTPIVTPGFQQSEMAGWRFQVNEEPDYGEFRYLRWSWKRAAGSAVALELAHGGVFGTDPETYVPPPRLRRYPSRSDNRGPRNGFRYVEGDVDPDDPRWTPAIALEVTDTEGTTHKRDLYADFGRFELTGVGVAVKEQPVELTELWLARSSDHFEFINQMQGAVNSDESVEPQKTTNPLRFAKLTNAVMPNWVFVGQAAELELLSPHAGRDTVIKTSVAPQATKTNCHWSAIVDVPASRRWRLTGAVMRDTPTTGTGHDPWGVQVLVNGEPQLETPLSLPPDNADWVPLEFEISATTGEKARIELQVLSPEARPMRLYWDSLELEAVGGDGI